jgi:hypothetical protein
MPGPSKASVAAVLFVVVAIHMSLAKLVDALLHHHPRHPLRQFRLAPCYDAINNNDDDAFALNHQNRTSSFAPTTINGVGAYRRIEDWYDDTHNPNHVIDHLKREQARWAKTFEDLGGDGI